MAADRTDSVPSSHDHLPVSPVTLTDGYGMGNQLPVALSTCTEVETLLTLTAVLSPGAAPMSLTEFAAFSLGVAGSHCLPSKLSSVVRRRYSPSLDVVV